MADKEIHEIMTVDEVAKYLRCHRSSVYRMLKARKIPAWKFGSDWRFSRSAIEKWVAAQAGSDQLK